MSADGCGFNRWMQHLASNYRGEDVVNEAADPKKPGRATWMHRGRLSNVLAAGRRLCKSWQQLNDIIPVYSPKIVLVKQTGLIESPGNCRTRIPGREIRAEYNLCSGYQFQ